MTAKTIAPRWLALSMLPVLTAAMYVVNTEAMMAAVRFAEARTFDLLSSVAVMSSWALGPLITALIFAYPIARLYSRWSIAAAVLIGLPTILYRASGSDDDLVMSLVLTLPLAILLPALAWLAHRALAGSQLQVAVASPDALARAEPAFVSPRALKLVLLPISAGGLFILHDLVQAHVYDFTDLSHTRAIEFTGSFLGPAVVALAMAYPIARIYGSIAPLIGALISIPTLCYWLPIYLHDGKNYSSFDIAECITEMVSTAGLTSLMAWAVLRKLGDSRLVIAKDSHIYRFIRK